MEPGVSFNIKYVKKKTRAQFVKEFEKIYPKLDLREIYDQIKKSK